MIGRYKLGDSLPGPGDPETWPAYTGHPNDPRGDPDETEETDDEFVEIDHLEEAALAADEQFGNYPDDR